jgi:hypothetical protein
VKRAAIIQKHAAPHESGTRTPRETARRRGTKCSGE